MPSSKQRTDVWRGIRKKTSGGLTKADLIKNKRGKLVSKKKSGQASDQNNLGNWLRETGRSVPKDKMLYAKGAKKAPAKDASPQKKEVGKPSPKSKVEAAKPKAKAVVKPKPKPAAPKKSAPKPSAPKSKPKKRKLKSKSNINPLTQQPYAPKSKIGAHVGPGFVEGGKVHLDNITTRPKRRRKKDAAYYMMNY